MEESLFERAISIANEKFDGHLTIMKFTNNWKVSFGTYGERFEILAMPEGKTLNEALKNLLDLFSFCEEDGDIFTAEMDRRANDCELDFWEIVQSDISDWQEKPFVRKIFYP